MKGYLQSLPVVGKIFLDVKPEEVWAFWRFMQDHFRTSVINKSSALEMQLVARGLEALGVQSKEFFLKNFTTTIGRRIYTPFEVGSPKGGWDLWHQVVICVHEHQHVVQHDREGLAYEVSYLADRAARANRAWTLTRPHADYAGRYLSDTLGTIDIGVSGQEMEVRAGVMHAIATPFTQPDSIRVELSPGQGWAIAFEMGANGPIGLSIMGERFTRA